MSHSSSTEKIFEYLQNMSTLPRVSPATITHTHTHGREENAGAYLDMILGYKPAACACTNIVKTYRSVRVLK